MPVIPVVEGSWFQLDNALQPAFRRSVAEVERRVRPRFKLLEESNGQFKLGGVVGTFAVGSHTALDVAPKVEPGDNWIASVLDLLTGADRVQAAGDRRSGVAAHRNLLDVLASLYAERLVRALRREGPVLVMERRDATKSVLKGRLNVTSWARRAAWEPHKFPVSFQELTADNDFSRALAHVATLLARSTTSPRTRGLLLDCARGLRPGEAEAFAVNPQSALRPLPSQWAAYQPAWDIAVTVLSRRSLLGTVGHRHGVSLAIEAWPLLERLLERSLRAAVAVAADQGVVLKAPAKSQTRLLGGLRIGHHDVEPDGRLTDESDEHVATFEAKYARRVAGEWPPREHYFQALSTAAACGSDLAVLTYPESFEPVWWEVHGFQEKPAHLAAIGLGLFSYRRGSGDSDRGARILDLLNGPPAAAETATLTADV